ncbi:N-acetylmuramoyl-L-alanine amidase [Thomasclavelia cocleata]|uniref:N-acetylmuramoyl-L-alanine amidase n=1 Tax=Thomasclavelia cocleata TaxID=69824 RepID=UPI00258BD5F8|nr:N-acetylmuramoyl-L-alanine amidase [Thomasclavelia cocleata]
MKIAINCGHTLEGPGSGAIGIINESIETRNVGERLIRLLKNNGHKVTNCTVDKANSQAEYLKETVELVNKEDVDYFISIHFNAGGGKGIEVYTYKGKILQPALNICKDIELLGFNNRGIKDGSNLYVINRTKAKSILVEVCFVDSDDANRYLELGPGRIAEAIYQGISNENLNDKYDNWIAGLQEELNKQYSSNLTVNGINSDNILIACPIVRINACGNITKLIQERLNSVGFNIVEDGIFGSKTKDAVKVFQKNRGLKQDGIVGKNTWKYLLSGEKY